MPKSSLTSNFTKYPKPQAHVQKLYKKFYLSADKIYPNFPNLLRIDPNSVQSVSQWECITQIKNLIVHTSRK